MMAVAELSRLVVERAGNITLSKEIEELRERTARSRRRRQR
jgi:hypothetical protein